MIPGGMSDLTIPPEDPPPDCTCQTRGHCYCYDNGHTGNPGETCLVCTEVI